MTHPTRCAVHPYRARPVKRSPHRSGHPRTGRINSSGLSAAKQFDGERVRGSDDNSPMGVKLPRYPIRPVEANPGVLRAGSSSMVLDAYGSAMGRETGAGCVDRLLFVVGTRKSVSLSIPKLTPWA
jgi:hypothetical protein